MSDKEVDNKENKDNKKNIIQFKVDKPFRMFVGEIKGDMVKKISTGEQEGFKDGDKVVVMHGEDWLWFLNELNDVSRRKPVNYHAGLIDE